MGASSASAINMMDTMDDHVYCNSTTVTVATPVTVTSPSAVTTCMTTTTVASSLGVPKPAVMAQQPCPHDDGSENHYQQSSPSQYSPSPSSPVPSIPASPRPSSPVPTALVPVSSVRSSPLPSMEDEPVLIEDDDAEPDAELEDNEQEEYDEAENEPEEDFENDFEYEEDENENEDAYDHGSNNGERDEEILNIPSDSGVLTDDQQGDEHGDASSSSQLELMADKREAKQLQSILLLHLDLIQEQGDQILSKDKMINRLKDENDMLKHQLDVANRNVSMMILQLRQSGIPLPLEVQQLLPQRPKQEGTVSPLTIRRQMENGRLKSIILKNSASPPFVSSTIADGPIFGPCLPIRNSEVSSTVSPIKEELTDEIVLQPEAVQSPYYDAGDDDEDEDAKTENNEVDGEIFLNYSKSDDDESLSAGTNYDYQENEEDAQDELYKDEQQQDQQLQQQQQLLLLQQQPHAVYQNYDGLQHETMEEADYESNGVGEEDSPMPYASDDQCAYDGAPMMLDVNAVEVAMETNSPISQESQESQDSQISQESQDSQQSPQHAAVGPGMAVNVPFVESTVGSEGDEQAEDDDCKESEDDVGMAQAAQSTKVTKGNGRNTMGTAFGCSASGEGRVNERENRGGSGSGPRQFNPTVHCPSGNSSDGSMAPKRSNKHTPAYMVTQKQYVSCSWKDDAITAELEKLLSNEAAELEIPSWTVVEEQDDEEDLSTGGRDRQGSGSFADDESVSASEPSRENISDEAYMKRHTKLEIDERRRKKWDVQRIREQKNIERLKKRQLKDQPSEQEAQKAITSLYPTVETLKYIQVTDDMPVQAFGELIPMLPSTGGFSLPWHQLKPGPSFANPASSSSGLLHHHVPPLPGPSGSGSTGIGVSAVGGLLHEMKTKFLHRLVPSMQAQKQRFTKRIKKDL